MACVPGIWRLCGAVGVVGSFRSCLAAGLVVLATFTAAVTALAASPAMTAQPEMTTRRELRIGIMAPEGSFDVLHDWRFVGPTLEGALPGYTVRTEAVDEERLREKVAHAQMDFLIANSGFFVEMAAAYGATALATVESPAAVSPREALGSAIIVMNGRTDLRELADLRHQRLIAVSEGLFGGFQVGLHALQQAGVRRSDLRDLRFVGYDLRLLLEDLQSNRADAAILRRCLLEKLTSQPQYRREAFRVLNPQPADGTGCARTTRMYPDWAFAALKGTDPELARIVTLALLRMPRSADGHSWSVPTDYESVHGVLRDLEVGPYEYLSGRTLQGFFERNRLMMGLAALLVLGAFAHVSLAEWQVRRRTAQLRRALADRDRMAADVRHREEELLHLSRLGALGEMSSMLAHELAQPLASISNFAHGIVRRVQAGLDDPAPLAEAGEEIVSQAERARQIMQRVRGFAAKRVEARVAVDLEQVVRSAVALLRGIAPDAPAIHISVESDAGDRRPIRAMADRLQIEQVLLNLFRNSMEAMAGMPADQQRIEVRLRRAGPDVELEVCDQGEGLSADALEHLFQPFHTTKPNGVGLGLAICKRVIEAHGGHIDARTCTSRRGLLMWILLPALDERTSRAASTGASMASEARP